METGIEKIQLKRGKDSKIRLLGRFLSYSILANGPWLLVIVCSTIVGYYIASVLLPAERATLGLVISLATPLSLILTAGFQALETKIVLDKIAVGDNKTAGRFTLKIYALTGILCLIASSIAIGLESVLTGSLFTSLLFAAQFSALSFLWIAVAPIIGLRKFGQLTAIFAAGSIAGYALSVLGALTFGVSGVVAFQSLGFFTASIGTFIYLNIILKSGKNVAAELAARRVALFKILEDIRSRFEKGELFLEEYQKLVKEFGQLLVKIEHDITEVKTIGGQGGVSLIGSLKNFIALFLANTLYFATLWADRFFIWFSSGQATSGLFIAFNVFYETGINIAQWILIPGVGLIAVLMELFTPNFQKTVSGTYKDPLPKLEENLKGFYKFFRRIVFTSMSVILVFSIILNIFGENIISIFLNLSDPLTPKLTIFGVTMPAALFVFRMATIGVIFHTATILCYLGLMYLEQHSLNVWLMLLTFMANIVLCPLLAIISGSVYLAVFGYIAAFLIGTVIGLQLVRKNIMEFPYRAYSTLL